MAITIINYSFQGPFQSPDELNYNSGVYVILCFANNKYIVIDVGQASDIKSRIENHDRKDCWRRNCSGQIQVAVLYTPGMSEEQRKRIEKEIRDYYNPPCGER